MGIVEKQVIAIWHELNEKEKPKDGQIVVVSVSGKLGKNITYDHAFALAEYWSDE